MGTYVLSVHSNYCFASWANFLRRNKFIFRGFERNPVLILGTDTLSTVCIKLECIFKQSMKFPWLMFPSESHQIGNGYVRISKLSIKRRKGPA